MTNEEKAVLEKSLSLYVDGWAVVVVRKSTDPQATRVSIGGGNRDAYCTYRGDIADAIEVTRAALQALVTLQYRGREPEIAPDAGKKFA